MPQELKRQGILTSKIVFGFPITGEKQPKRESQRVDVCVSPRIVQRIYALREEKGTSNSHVPRNVAEIR